MFGSIASLNPQAVILRPLPELDSFLDSSLHPPPKKETTRHMDTNLLPCLFECSSFAAQSIMLEQVGNKSCAAILHSAKFVVRSPFQQQLSDRLILPTAGNHVHFPVILLRNEKRRHLYLFVLFNSSPSRQFRPLSQMWPPIHPTVRNE